MSNCILTQRRQNPFLLTTLRNRQQTCIIVHGVSRTFKCVYLDYLPQLWFAFQIPSQTTYTYTTYTSVLVIVDTCFNCVSATFIVCDSSKRQCTTLGPQPLLSTLYNACTYTCDLIVVESVLHSTDELRRPRKIFWYFRPYFHHVPLTAVILRERLVDRTLPLYRGFYNIISINNQFWYLITFIIFNYQLFNKLKLVLVYTMDAHCTFLQFTYIENTVKADNW